MDKEKVNIFDDGVIAKSVGIEAQEVTEADLNKINKFTLSPLTAEDVFIFKTEIGDNETDDRNYEPFNLQALKDLKDLYLGKTIIKDHRRSADNQVARVYDTELITEPKLTKAGEPFTRLITKNYMVRTESNADLIKEIQAGIKKEVSTGVLPKKAVCNICGTDNTKEWCSHWPGREYTLADGSKAVCLMTLDGAKEAYELSLVAVPAQPRAGTIKHYGATPPETDDKKAETPEIEEKTPEIEPTAAPETENKDSEINLRVKALESFIFAQVNENS